MWPERVNPAHSFLHTVRAGLQAAASINFEGLWVRLLFESGFYSRFFNFIYISKLPMKRPFQNGAYCFCSLNNKKVMKENKKKVIFTGSAISLETRKNLNSGEQVNLTKNLLNI